MASPSSYVADSVAQLLITEAIASVARASPLPAGEGGATVAEAEREESHRMVVAAKIELMGHSIGYRFIERIAQQR